MDVILNVIVEARPRLRSCNVSLLTKSDFADNYHLKVSVRPNFIIVNYTDNESKTLKKKNRSKVTRKDSVSSCESCTDSEDESYDYSKYVDISPHFMLLPNSLSSLKVEQNYISFRILTEPSKSSKGTFFNEVLNCEENTNSLESLYKYVTCINRNTIDINGTEEIILKCANCSQIVSNTDNGKNLSFKRILELPSDNLDVSDWFCHNHGCSSVDNSESSRHSHNLHNKFTPSTSDLYYGLSHFVINISNAHPSLLSFNKKRSVINCNRCFSWLGVFKDSECCKLWSSCIKISKVNLVETNRDFHLLNHLPCTTANVALNDFLFTVKYGIKNSLSSAISSTCKMLMECLFSHNKKHYLFIWVMDKQLDILKMKHENDSDNKNANEIKLEHILTSKLFFKIDDSPETVNSWIEDSAVQQFEISKDMFLEGNKHLTKMSEYIPHSFKCTNDFYVTYLEI